MEFKSLDFADLVQLPESERDDRWELAFFRGLCEQSVEVIDAPPRTGPDGWPYLQVRAGRLGDDAARGGERRLEPFSAIARWLAGRGIGLVVNAHKMVPDYVFTYGMIWSFVETGRFFTASEAQPGQVILDPGQKPIVGAPSEAFLPPYVRSILREFLYAQGFEDVEILAMTDSSFKQADLLFSSASLKGLEESDYSTFAEAVGWFLPPHYSVVMANPSAGLPPFILL